MSARVVDVLFFDGCPNIDVAVERVRSAAVAAKILDVDVRLVRVETEDEAARSRFLGSPSVRVDGVDVELAARTREDFALQCRVYPKERGGLDGAPPGAWIRAALLGEDVAPAESDPTAGAAAHDCCASRPG